MLIDALPGQQATLSSALTAFSKEEVERSIAARFEFIAHHHAGRPAVSSSPGPGQGPLTYEALNQAANRVARAILACCGQGSEPIALLFEHGPSLIVAILGVLKAGKAYVALDPDSAPVRLTAILADLPTRLLLTNDRNLALADSLAHGLSWVLNSDALGLNLPARNVRLAIPPDAPAAIFYTADSTGQARGVTWDQRSVLHGVWIETNDDHINAGDNISLLTSCSLAASAAGIFKALLNGAALCLYDVRAASIGPLAGWLAQEEITFLHLPVAFFRRFLDGLAGREIFPKLRQVTPAGRLYRRDVERSLGHFPAGCRLVQHLAYAETGLACRLIMDRHTVIPRDVTLVGYPVADKEILLLNEAGVPAGSGEIGEIAVRSRYLAPGYWRRPELTQKSFYPDPDGGDRRLYRTGDLGRLRPDGCLEFMGPADSQLKIRGCPVNLGQVEAALYSLDGVREAAVVAQRSPSGEQRLVAYVVPAGPPASTRSSLRAALAQTLPDEALPAVFVLLDELPLTPNGKVDRRALP